MNSRVSIALDGPPNNKDDVITICGKTPSDGKKTKVRIFKNKPEEGVTINSYYCVEGRDGLINLYGGEPDAYETILHWTSTAGQHRFEFDPSGSGNWFKVLHYWNCDPEWSVNGYYPDLVTHLNKGANGAIQPDDLFAIEMVEIVKLTHIVAEMGARSLKQLVECVAQINEIGAGLLPLMIKETQKTHLALDRLQKRANEKLPLIARPDPASCPKPELKSHPGSQ